MLLAELDRRIVEIGGCTDGNCVIAIPRGMHTNGGCRCWMNAQKMQKLARLLMIHRKFYGYGLVSATEVDGPGNGLKAAAHKEDGAPE